MHTLLAAGRVTTRLLEFHIMPTSAKHKNIKGRCEHVGHRP